MNNNSKPKPFKMHLLEMMSMLVKIKKCRIDVPCDAYNRMMDSGLIQAIKRCEKEEQAIFDMEYPLADNGMLHGYMGLKSYLLNLYYENTFCSVFNSEELVWLYETYCERSDTFTFNIFTRVYFNALFCDYLKKEFGTLRLTREDCAVAQKLLSAYDEEKQIEMLSNSARRLSYGSAVYNNKQLDRMIDVLLTSVKKKSLSDFLVVTE